VASAPLIEDYLRLGLRLGRHVDGLVDAYYGPEELSREVEEEKLSEPSALVEQGDALLAGLDDGWLRDQALGLRTYAGVLAGEELSYSDEVEACYGVRPERVATDVYEAVHERLDELLPIARGPGDLAERYEAWRNAAIVPPDRVVPALREVADELRARTAALLDLPAGEELVVEEGRDEPWWAFNYYRGGLRSRVVVNLDVPTTCDDVVELAAHEVYPGHHTEHAVKERHLIRDQGRLEESIQLVPTPAALVSEGIAETGSSIVVDGDVPIRMTEILRRHDLDYDYEQARAVREARRPLRRLSLDAALMIHEDGASVEEAEAHLRRWGLVTPDQAVQSVRFVTDPTWRAYVITYSAGRKLCHAWVGGDPARFVRLLTDHVRVGDLLTAVSSSP
jgi:hypothetical protein